MRKLKILSKIGATYISNKFGKSRPLFCSYFMTMRCNMNCKFCLRDDKKFRWYSKTQDEEMTTDQAKEAIDKISKLEVPIFSFTGGEPTLRADLLELAEYARKNFFISLNTNGMNLDKADFSVFDRITVSLDGTRERHDSLRGKRSFDKVVRRIKDLVKSGSDVTIYCVLNNENFRDSGKMVELSKDIGSRIMFIPVGFVDGFYLDEREAVKTRNELVSLKRENKRTIANSEEYLNMFSKFLVGDVSTDCRVFDLHIAMSPKGDIGGCCFPYPIGNILEDDMNEILKNKNIFGKEVKSRCGGCGFACYVEPKIILNAPFLDTLSSHLHSLSNIR